MGADAVKKQILPFFSRARPQSHYYSGNELIARFRSLVLIIVDYPRLSTHFSP